MHTRFRSQKITSRMLGIAEARISAYVVPLARHFNDSILLGPGGMIFLDERGMKLLLSIHMMSNGDGLSLGQIDAILECAGGGEPPGWAAGAMRCVSQAGPLMREMGRLWRSHGDDPLTERLTRSYCTALYEDAE